MLHAHDFVIFKTSPTHFSIPFHCIGCDGDDKWLFFQFGMGANLYLHAGASRQTWIEHLEADPRLRARIEGRIYELAAVRVHDAKEFARFADAYQTKYNTRPRNENIAEIYVMRLEAR